MRAFLGLDGMVILPVFFSGALLLVVTLGSVDDRGGSDGEEVSMSAGHGDRGHGYVEVVPNDAPPLDPAEKERAMDQAKMMARMGAGWEEGEMLAHDLGLLIESARSQLDMYREELERLRGLEAESPDDLRRVEGLYQAAESHLAEFETAGERLRGRMAELQRGFEALESFD